MLPLDRRRQIALDMARAAIAAADPRTTVRRAIEATDDALRVGTWRAPWSDVGRAIVVGAGKAAWPMAEAAEEALGDRLAAGLVVTKEGHGASPGHQARRRVRIVEAGHPVPDERGVRAADELLHLVSGLSPRDVVIVLLSGGGSALLVAPAEGITLADKQATTGLLLASGATIGEINCVRKHLSRVKGGQLVRACAPARVVALALSDVIGDPLDVIASGPTVPDPTTYVDALAVLDRYGLREKVPPSVVARLVQGAAGALSETSKADDPAFARAATLLIGTNRVALDAAARTAEMNGYRPRVLTSSLRGEAREVAKVICALAEGVAPQDRPAALVFGGETTVTLSPDAGRGGRNQELALAAAIEIAGRDDVVILSMGTDGTDGPTDAAGGIADGGTVERARDAGCSPGDALRRHDAYPLLEATGDLIVTGPTGTNVMDVVIALVG